LHRRRVDLHVLYSGGFLRIAVTFGRILSQSFQYFGSCCCLRVTDFYVDQGSSNVRGKDPSCSTCSSTSSSHQSCQRTEGMMIVGEKIDSMIYIVACCPMRGRGNQNDRQHYVGHLSTSIYVRLHGRPTVQSKT
jgi:hypothetical protein